MPTRQNNQKFEKKDSPKKKNKNKKSKTEPKNALLNHRPDSNNLTNADAVAF